MKKFAIILCALAAACFTANAQENNNRDANGNIVRGAYETNKGKDNWFVGVAGGAAVFMDTQEDYGFGNITPALDINFGKWFTPAFGIRAGYQGLLGAQDATKIIGSNVTTKYDAEFKYMYFHGDLLWNISDAISGYKETRLWNFIPYAHAGVARLNDINDESAGNKPHRVNPYDNEAAFGAGLLNNIRLHEKVNAYIDLRWTTFSARFHDWYVGGRMNEFNAFLGLSYNIGKSNWKRVGDNTSLKLAEDALANAQAQILALKNAPKDTVVIVKEVMKEAEGDTQYVPLALGIPPITLYFEINSTELNVTERQHLRFYVENILNLDPERKFYLTGSADSGTGTQSINERLSKGRVEKVIEILKNEYGVSDDRLILKGTKITDEAPDPRLDRSVIIVH